MAKHKAPLLTHQAKLFVFTAAALCFFVVSAGLVWVSMLQLPDFKSFDERKTEQSTKIYDRTGKVLLYDVHQNFRRTVIPYENMGAPVKDATVAIEDAKFYDHNGIRLSSIARAMLVNLFQGDFVQGGSTITQQVVKNTLLTTEKTATRKLKEWILALKLERVMTKDEILAIYLNESPYGGSIYGIQEASQNYFHKDPAELSLAEAAYLAAIPKAPTYYSPYGTHKDKLDARKNLVLSRMHDLDFITDTDYDTALKEVVAFQPPENTGIKAPHFVFFIKEYLEEKYGQEVVENGGLRVLTTLDYELQEQAEEIVKRNALQNEKDWGASNAAMVAMDPKTGQILVMVGSRDYFDTAVDGNYNVATARRQPGSSFKPFVYATAFKEGYTPATALFDVPTEFQGGCDAYGHALAGHNPDSCYMPANYDNKFVGPITMKNALAQSRNVPSVKTLYLAGVADSISTARDMGITTLTSPEIYGLTLVLGGGEVSLLDMTSAYGTFATTGIHHPSIGILEIDGADGEVLEKYEDSETQALDKNVALMISDILSDNVARTPLFGSNSFMYFPGYDVAAKTGTTNNNKDAWLLGYTPTVALGVWSGNNDNKPMKKGSAISGPMWHEFMNILLKKIPQETFEKPLLDTDPSLKPVLRGVWLGGQTYSIDTISGKLATDQTPMETQEEVVVTDVHDILYWVDKDNPRGPVPENPAHDPQFGRWEQAAQDWWNTYKYGYPITKGWNVPDDYDDVHSDNAAPSASLVSPDTNKTYATSDKIIVTLNYSGDHPLKKFDVFIDSVYVGSSEELPNFFSFVPEEYNIGSGNHEIKVVVYDSVYNRQEIIESFDID